MKISAVGKSEIKTVTDTKQPPDTEIILPASNVTLRLPENEDDSENLKTFLILAAFESGG